MPAYLDPKLQAEDLKTGVSFASGACGYDPQTAVITVGIFHFCICILSTHDIKNMYTIKSL